MLAASSSIAWRSITSSRHWRRVPGVSDWLEAQSSVLRISSRMRCSRSMFASWGVRWAYGLIARCWQSMLRQHVVPWVCRASGARPAAAAAVASTCTKHCDH